MSFRPPRGDRPPPTLKRLGQHFLTDHRVLEQIADALQLTGAETVVEIGPGRGALTDILARRAGRLVAVEVDRALAGLLRERYASMPGVEIVERDVLEVPLGDLAGDDFVLAGNVPYYITTPIIFHALDHPRPRRAVYLVQREVAERAVAPPGSRTYGALSVNLQSVARVEQLFAVPPGAFRPPPKVDSAVIRVTPRADPAIAPEEEHAFRAFVQGAFGLRRKQLQRVLRTLLSLDASSAEGVLARAGVKGDVRPETLGPEEFARVFRARTP